MIINATLSGVDTTATATAGDILASKTAWVNDEQITGAIPTKTASNLTASGATVTVPAGYYASQVTKSIANGSATTPATTITQSTPSLSVASSTGIVTASVAQKTQNVTPTVSAGYVSTGTAGTITLGSSSNTLQLSTQAAKTVTPSESSQTAVTAGKYTTGAVTVGAISTTYVGSGIARRTSSNLTVSGTTVTAPAGYYASAASKSIGTSQFTPAVAVGTIKNLAWSNMDDFRGGLWFFNNQCLAFPISYGTNGWFSYYWYKTPFGDEDLAQYNLPFTYGYHSSMCIFNNKLYIVASSNSSYSTVVFYSYNGSSWTSLASPGTGQSWRGHLVGANGKLYLFDSGTGCKIYNISSNSWSTGTATASISSKSNGIYVNGTLYVVGYASSKYHLYTVNLSTGALTDKGTVPSYNSGAYQVVLYNYNNTLKCYSWHSLDGSSNPAIYTWSGSAWTKESDSFLSSLVMSEINWSSYDGINMFVAPSKNSNAYCIFYRMMTNVVCL